MINVLVLASSPIDQAALQLGKEHKSIMHSLNSATNREQFRIIHCAATTVDDLRRYLLEYSPTIVHFCGHGAGEEGLCFEADDGATHTVDGERLAKLFHLVNEEVKCVVLNACLSEPQARAISQHIDFVVGMRSEIGDIAALKFAQGFYEAIWSGQSYDKAFKFGCSAIDTAGIPEQNIPVIHVSPRLGGTRLEYTEETQKLENFILQYLKSDLPERSRMTTRGETILPLMIKQRGDAISKIPTAVSVIGQRDMYHGFKEIRAIIRSGLDAGNFTYYVRPDGDSFLMNWEATCGYWPIPFKTYLALGCGHAMTVRVEATLSDYFNFGFESGRYISVEMRHIEGRHIYGFIHHGHRDFKSLIGLLYDGNTHRICVEIGSGRENNSCVSILRFVSESWIILPESEDPLGNTRSE